MAMTSDTSTAVAAQAAATVRRFFDAYRDHDIGVMADCCAPSARIHYAGVEMWGRQRAIRGDGFVEPVGRIIWTGTVESFPDLNVTVDSVTDDDEGNVACEVTFAGTQAKPWGVIANHDRSFSLPNLFIFHVDDSGAIDRIAAYWDNAELGRQLGHLEVD